MRPRARGARVALTCALTLATTGAHAEPSVAARDEAKARFERGVGLLRDDALEAALAEFLASRRLAPTRGNTRNAAVVLRKLHRFDESMELFEALLREFPEQSAEELAAIRREIDELRGSVGELEIALDEPGATVLIDGKDRGRLPLGAPLRVSAGERTVRVLREGRAPFEERVSVAGQQRARVTGRLVAIAALGRLRVEEASGAGLELWIDGAQVGRTPWEGALAAGPHVAWLRGPAGTGSAPLDATVRADATSTLRVPARALSASLRVEADAPGVVVVDGVELGAAPREVRLPSGATRVEVRFSSRPPWSATVSLRDGETRVVRATERNVRSIGWEVSLDVGGGAGRTLGGELDATCKAGCERGLVLAGLARVGLGARLMPSLAVGAEAAWIGAGQALQGRSDVITPNGRGPAPGAVTDELRLRAYPVGAWLSLRHGARVSVQGRLGLGVAPHSVRDERRGQYSVDQLVVAATSTADGGGVSLYASPEVRASVALGARVSASAGLAVWVFSPLRPATRDATRDEVLLSSGDLAGHPRATLSGTWALVAPSVGITFSP